MNKKIYIQNWLSLKPYSKQTITDTYYLKLCNEVKRAIMNSNQLTTLGIFIDPEEIDLLACILTSYFEDIISKINIWNSFISIHQRLYKKQLPFYTLDEYYDGEINIQDVSFLIWYFLNTIQEEKFIAPFNLFITETAEKVFEIFYDEWEYAPENNYLKLYYQIAENEENYYVARNFIDTVLFKSYLFYTDTFLKLKATELEILEECSDDKNLLMIFNENRDSMLHKNCTRLLSLSGKEWVSEIIGNKHSLSNEFLKISQKIRGYFLYKGQDEADVFLEHIASGKKFKLTKKSFDYSNELKEIDTIIFMGIVKWKGEWWFSGIQFQTPYNADLILDEKNSIESRMTVNFLDHQEEKVNELLENQMKAFKDFNNGLQIAFMPSADINKFINDYTSYFNKSLNLSEKENRDAIKRARKDGFFGTKNNSLEFNNVSDAGLVFFNPKSGCEVVLGLNAAFPLQNNPYFEEELSEEHFKGLLMDESISPEIVFFCIENCKEKLPFLNSDLGKKYLDDIDFLLRFWKKENYHTKPAITFTGVKD